MKKTIFQKSEPLILLIEKMGWKTFHFQSDHGNSGIEVSPSSIETLLTQSHQLLGLKSNEFCWSGSQKLEGVNSLASYISHLESNKYLRGLLVIPYVDGGLIVLTADEKLRIEGEKSAEWWYLHY